MHKGKVIFCRGIVVMLVFVWIAPFTACGRQPSEKKQIDVVFRFDDYSARSSADIERRIIDIFCRNKASVTFGVIPYVSAGDAADPSPQDIVPLTSVKGDILKSAYKDGILDVALHGYSHQTIRAGQMTEFSGLDYNSQAERLTKGKKLLEGMTNAPVTIFIPPWNKYDLNTLSALRKLGFSILSANKDGEAPKGSMLDYLPETCDLILLPDAVKEARSAPDNHPVIVVVFHSYDFREVSGKHGKITWRQLSDLLSWLRSQGDVRLLSVGQASKEQKTLSADRFLMNKRIGSISYLLPSWLRGRYGRLYLGSEFPLIKTLFLIGVFYLMIAVFGAVASYMAARSVFPRSASAMYIGTLGIIALSVVLSTYNFYIVKAGLNSIAITFWVVGASIGAIICFIHLKKI